MNVGAEKSYKGGDHGLRVRLGICMAKFKMEEARYSFSCGVTWGDSHNKINYKKSVNRKESQKY